MVVCRGLPTYSDTPLALTIGNFDGVHCGHQAMLEQMKAAATAHGVPAAGLTFVPPPREFFAPQHAPPPLSTISDKLERLAQLGIDRADFPRLHPALANPPPDQVLEPVLV